MTKPTKNAAMDRFVPSTGEESYISGKPDVDLPSLAKEINSGYANGIALAQRATQQMIEVGSLLLQARQAFPSNAKFGLWRRDHIEFSQSHTARLMSVAKEFADQPDSHLLPIGTLAELLPASPELKAEVIAEAKAGAKPTRAEVTQRKKAEASPPESAAAAAADFEEVESPVPVDYNPEFPPSEPWQAAQRFLDLPFIERLEALEVRGVSDAQHNALIIFGIPPYHDGLPSRDSLYAIYSYHDDLEPDQADKMTEAYDVLIELYE